MSERDYLAAAFERDPEGDAIAKKLRAEQRAAEASMAWELANLLMPEDIRARARAWRMEAWAEVLWNNAFQAGYRQAIRARGATDDR